MARRNGLQALNQRIVGCDRCPRLRQYCRQIARQKRAQYQDWAYWGQPVPNFFPDRRPEAAKLLIVGLAPAAHGANRTGRMFTGDRSGDLLYRTLHAAGLANQPGARGVDDGLVLRDCVISAAAHCAPPRNKPTRDELINCSEWFEQTFDLLTQLRALVCLGKIAMDAVLRFYQGRGWIEKRSVYKFAHGAEHRIEVAPTLLCSYHPSQQNTFTGRLTEEMFREVFERAHLLITRAGPRDSPASA